MSKEESLAFLQNCMEKLNTASEQDIQFFKDVYQKNCVLLTEPSDFEFVFPTNDLQCNYVISDEFDLDICSFSDKQVPKKQLGYVFLGEDLLNQQNNDNLPFAA